jgi:hypothetical protein
MAAAAQSFRAGPPTAKINRFNPRAYLAAAVPVRRFQFPGPLVPRQCGRSSAHKPHGFLLLTVDRPFIFEYRSVMFRVPSFSLPLALQLRLEAASPGHSARLSLRQESLHIIGGASTGRSAPRQ